MSADRILEMKSITMDFPGVRALDHVSVGVQAATIHALVGENGAGKSTLMKVLSGSYPAGSYTGDVLIDGAVQRFRSIADGERAGVAIIHQELANAKELSICENLFMGQELSRHGVVDWDEEFRVCRKALADVSMEGVHPGRKIKELGVGQQQLVEIAKALNKRARILILDEPTASLSETECNTLFAILRSLRERGVACIYISHRLDELYQIADLVTVLRDGKVIGTRPIDAIRKSELVSMMVGRDLTQMYPRKPRSAREPVLEVQGLTVYGPERDDRPVVKNVSFKAYRGEILGIAGLIGSGRTEMAMNIVGAWGQRTAGRVLLEGTEVPPATPYESIRAGISYLSENRKEQGLVLGMDVKENVVVSSPNRISRLGIIDHDREREIAEESVDALRIKCTSVDQRVATLSGGNQQKVCFAKWILTRPRVLILDEPTRGVDVGAKVEIYELVNSLVDDGVCVIFISSEHQEILGMCDRILVMGGGEVRAEMGWREATQERILSASIGLTSTGLAS